VTHEDCELAAALRGRAGGRASPLVPARCPPAAALRSQCGPREGAAAAGVQGREGGGRDGGREVYSQQSGLLKRTVLVGCAQGEGRQGEGSDGARGACQEGQMAWLQDIQSRRW